MRGREGVVEWINCVIELWMTCGGVMEGDFDALGFELSVRESAAVDWSDFEAGGRGV